MPAPVDLIQEPKMPMGIIGIKPVEAPQDLLQIVGYVHDVVDGIADKGLPCELLGASRTIVSQSREAPGHMCMFDPGLGWRSLVAFIGVTERCIMRSRQMMRSSAARLSKLSSASG
jgi:hypothetical protein